MNGRYMFDDVLISQYSRNTVFQARASAPSVGVKASNKNGAAGGDDDEKAKAVPLDDCGVVQFYELQFRLKGAKKSVTIGGIHPTDTVGDIRTRLSHAMVCAMPCARFWCASK
jgi:hypothetical protein